MRELEITNCDNNTLTFTLYSSDEKEVLQFREAFFGDESSYHIQKLGWRQETVDEKSQYHAFIIHNVDPDRFDSDKVLLSFFQDNNIESVPSIVWLPYVNAANDAWIAFYADGAMQDKSVGMGFNVYHGE